MYIIYKCIRTEITLPHVKNKQKTKRKTTRKTFLNLINWKYIVLLYFRFVVVDGFS